MSTATKRPLAAAVRDAEAFRALFPADCYEEWVIAGSVRRRKLEVGDVEHAIRPRYGDKPGAGLFAERVSLLWHRLDALVAAGTVRKHIYGESGFRWGPKYRGVDFKGFNHELFTADAETWPSTLAIRTGPAEFSQRLVAGLLRNQRRNIDGCVWACRRCPTCVGGRCDQCKTCDGTALEPVEKIQVKDERHYFALCGARWQEPEDRR